MKNDYFKTQFTNKDTGWDDIIVSKEGLRHDLAKTTNRDNFLIIPKLRELINKAVLVESNPDTEERRNIIAFHRFYSLINIDGKNSLVKFTIRETEDGKRYYETDLTEIKKPEFFIGHGNDKSFAYPFSGSINIKDFVKLVKENFGIKNEPSKIVDENGKPIRVYRGQVLDLGNIYEKGLQLMPIKARAGMTNSFGFFHTGDYNIANNYALTYDKDEVGNVNAEYLNIKNPLDITDLGYTLTEKMFYNELGEKGVVIYKKRFNNEWNNIWKYFDEGGKSLADDIRGKLETITMNSMSSP